MNEMRRRMREYLQEYCFDAEQNSQLSDDAANEIIENLLDIVSESWTL